ncbi:hypothetical protein Tco_0093054 [Tanacetum coccineum]
MSEHNSSNRPSHQPDKRCLLNNVLFRPVDPQGAKASDLRTTLTPCPQDKMLSLSERACATLASEALDNNKLHHARASASFLKSADFIHIPLGDPIFRLDACRMHWDTRKSTSEDTFLGDKLVKLDVIESQTAL